MNALDDKLKLDITDAKSRALNSVTRMLQRPDQLEKIDQFCKQVERKRMGVESRLKTAVQSQLEGVKTGIEQLSVAMKNVREVQNTMSQVENLMNLAFEDKHIKEIKEFSAEHRQLGAAMENLRQIFTVPESIQEIRTLLKENSLLSAHKVLRDLEISRDELLYEQHKLDNYSQADKDLLNRYFQDINSVNSETFRKVSNIIYECLEYAKKQPALLVSALRLVEREQIIDQELLRRKTYSGYIPPGRPKLWRETILENLKANAESSIVVTTNETEGSLGKCLTQLRFRIVSDLITINYLVSICFPPSYNILDRFVHWYHISLSNALERTATQISLDGNSIIELLIFIHSYLSANFMGNTELAIQKDKLPELLDQSQQDILLDKYFKTIKSNLSTWLQRSLYSETEVWMKNNVGDEPSADERGYFCTDLPFILSKMIREVLTVANSISSELKNKVYVIAVDEIEVFTQSFVEAMNSYKNKHLENRSLAKHYHKFMVASINNCKQIAEKFQKIKTELKVDIEDENPFDDKSSKVLDIMTETAYAGCKMLCEEVIIDLKPWFEKLLTKEDWLDNVNGNGPAETICVTVEDYSEDFCSLQPDYLFYLFIELERMVSIEYIKAIISKRLKFNPNPYENELERKQAAEQIITEADFMKNFFQKVSNSKESQSLDAIKAIADLLKCSPDMVELELSSLVSKHTDITAEHIRAFLNLRGDISSAEARNITESSLQQQKNTRNISNIVLFGDVTVPTGFFSR